jgi:glycosyltransferase involved in cell wall biosynthesis
VRLIGAVAGLELLLTMADWLMALRAKALWVGRVAYQYVPLPGHWKDWCVTLIYRIAGRLFRGVRHYELWLCRGVAPPPRELRRAGVQPRVLVVDRYVPQPDRDAGSRSIWDILCVLQHMGFAVVFWPRDLMYDGRYVPMLEREGIEVVWGASFHGQFGNWLARHGGEFDYVFISRPLVAREFLPAVRQHTRAKVLFYGHDLHHARLMREYALTGFAPLLWESTIVEYIERKLWRTVDVIYYPSSEETAVVRQTVPSARAFTLPLYYYDESLVAAGCAGARDGIIFVAGFAHRPNIDAANWLVSKIMPRVWDLMPAVHLWLVGSSPTQEVQALAGPKVSVTGFVSDDELVSLYRSRRVAVVPLRVGAGMKGKVVEALHHGVPLVTTPVGAQGLDELPPIIPVSSDPVVLAEKIVTLLRDDALWQVVSQAELDYARERFSREAMIAALALGMTMPHGA